MNPREQLDEYLSAITQRLRLAIFTRAGAVLALTALLFIAVAVHILDLRGYPVGGVIVSRIALLAIVVLLAVVLVWSPLRRLHRNLGATQLERQLPEQRGRIQTYLEQRTQRHASALVDLLAEDALKVARQSPLEQVVSPRHIWAASAMAALAVFALLLMLTVTNSHWGYGSRYVLLGVAIPRELVPVRQVSLQPGDATLRRNADLTVQANVAGFKPESVELFVHFADTGRFEQTLMQRTQDEGASEHYAFTLYALRAPLSYYVRADGVRSSEHQINVVDVPRIEQMQFAYSYPAWTHLPPRVETEARDIQAVADTRVKLSLRASAPLEDAMIVVGQDRAAMQANATHASGELIVARPAHYHIAARVAGEMVALTDEYAIAVVDDQAPSIEIVKPGRDARASSIEEVPIAVRAKDDFNVQSVELRIAVNGGEWRRVTLPAQSADVQAQTLLQLEELGGKQPLIPGDLITYYAVTGDRKQTAQTDLFMVEVQPFERRFTEGQGGGGDAGDGGGEQQQIAQRQRDLLIATWNLDRAKEQKRRTPEQLRDSAQMLANLQNKLAEQTATLIERTRARVRVDNDARVKEFIASLESAVQAMLPAAANLSALELQKAILSEQTALQMLQRAEASFRDIQVARSQSNQNSGAARVGRDISELYELEMDLSKNKYETEKELSQETQAPSIDAALEKLKELARRQQQLAEQRRPQQATSNAERWKQEQLRREAEELRRSLQAMATQQANQPGGSQGGSQGSPSNERASRQASEPARQTREALRSIESALQAMRNAKSPNNQRAAEEASRNLQQAAERMQRNLGGASAVNEVEQLADQAKKIAQAQRQSEVDINMALAAVPETNNPLRMRRDGLGAAQAGQLAKAKDELLRELQQLEDRLRNTAQTQRRTAPQTAERLSEIVDELSSVNVPSRLARIIIDLERGRVDQSVMGDSLATEALQNAATDLRNAAQLAAQEAKRTAQTAPPDAMLSEIAQLRRALQDARRPGVGSQGISATDAAQFATAIRQQLNAMQARVAAGAIGIFDLQALRAMSSQLRGESAQALAGNMELLRSVERLELAVLAVAERSRAQLAARSGAAAIDTTQDREAVAEYYRRLGK